MTEEEYTNATHLANIRAIDDTLCQMFPDEADPITRRLVSARHNLAMIEIELSERIKITETETEPPAPQ